MYPTLHDLRTSPCVNVPSLPPSFGFDSAAGLFFGAVIVHRARLVSRGALEDTYPQFPEFTFVRVVVVFPHGFPDNPLGV